MRVHGALVALIDVAPELTAEYNRWYELDHLPEHVSKGDVLQGRRYVAPKDLQGAGTVDGDVVPAQAPYLTIYYFGVADFDGPDARQGWTDKDRGLVKAGRFFRAGTIVMAGQWRFGCARARPSVLVSEEAVPYLAHRGVILAVGRARSTDERDDACRWWDEVHLPDLFAVDGVLAAVRFDPVGDAPADQILHVLLLDGDPAVVMPRVAAARRYAETVGRYPPHRGVYEPLAFAPYRTIQPLDDDFDL